MKLTRDAFCDLRNEAQRALRRSKETPSVLICAGTGYRRRRHEDL